MAKEPAQEKILLIDATYEDGYYKHLSMHKKYYEDYDEGFVCALCSKYPGLSKKLLTSEEDE